MDSTSGEHNGRQRTCGYCRRRSLPVAARTAAAHVQPRQAEGASRRLAHASWYSKKCWSCKANDASESAYRLSFDSDSAALVFRSSGWTGSTQHSAFSLEAFWSKLRWSNRPRDMQDPPLRVQTASWLNAEC